MKSQTAKTGKVTAIVVVMSIFKEKNVICRALISERRDLLAKRRKKPIFWRKISVDRGAFLKN
jgi:hypothetical protein